MSNTLIHPYIWTASGKQWVVEDLKPEMIDIKSIAYGLAKECRFGGQIEGFYSVANHSLTLREALSHKLTRPEWIYSLLHDAAEGYMKDMCKPIKVCLPDYIAMEERVMKVIAEAFDVTYPFPSIIKEYDHRIVVDEASVLFKNKPDWLNELAAAGVKPLGVKIACHTWEEDLAGFLHCFKYDLTEYHRAKKSGWVR